MSKEIRDIRIVFIIFSGIFFLFCYKLYPDVSAYFFLSLAVILLFCLTLRPQILRPLFILWIKVAKVVGKFNTRVLLALLFLLVFMPLGVMLRLRGKDLLTMKFGNTDSYWEPYQVEGLNDKSRYERQF